MNRAQLERDFPQGWKTEYYLDAYYDYQYEEEKNRESAILRIAELDLLATLLVIEKYEKSRASSLVNQYFSDADLYKEIALKIQCGAGIYNSNHPIYVEAMKYMQVALLLFRFLEEDEAVLLAKGIFSEECCQQRIEMELCVPFRQEALENYFGGRMGYSIASLYKKYKVKWKPSKYVAMMKLMEQGAPNKSIFFTLFEKNSENMPLENETDADQSNYEYFNFLCEMGAYDAAKSYLEKIWDVDKSLFGLSDEEIKALFCAMPSARIISFAYKYISSRQDGYTEHDWYQDVKKYNNDTKTLEWLEVHIHIFRLWELVTDKKYEEAFTYAQKSSDIKPFDFEANSYMTRMISRLAEIINILIENGQDVYSFLKKIEKISVYNYYKIKYANNYKNYVEEGSTIGETDYEQMKEFLFKECDCKKMLYVFMNSHLRFRIDIRDVVEEVVRRVQKDPRWKKNPNKQIEYLFQIYRIDGVVKSNWSKAASRNKLQFEPIYLMSKWTQSYAKSILNQENELKQSIAHLEGEIATLHEKMIVNPEEEDILHQKELQRLIVTTKERLSEKAKERRSAYNKIMRNDEDWYFYNKKLGELFTEGDYCTFTICGYANEGGYILVDKLDKLDYTEDIKQREEFPAVVVKWLKEIQEKKKVVSWEKPIIEDGKQVGISRPRVFGVRNVKTQGLREAVAVEILKTIKALLENELELENFLRIWGSYPYEEINEFRYIESQSGLDISDTDFSSIKDECQSIAKDIFSCDTISMKTKFYIYRSTCIKLFVKLEEALKYEGMEQFIFSKGLYFPVKYERKEGEKYIFSINISNPVRSKLFSSDFLFEYAGDPTIVEQLLHKYEKSYEKVFRVSIGSLKSDKFEIVDIEWENNNRKDNRKFIRILRDMKQMAGEQRDLDKIKEKFEQESYDFMNERNLYFFTKELDLVFSSYSYNAMDCSKVLDALDENNCYRHGTDIPLAKMEYTNYQEAYKEFIGHIQKETNLLHVCYVYYNSYLKMVKSEEHFFQDLRDIGFGQEEINKQLKVMMG